MKKIILLLIFTPALIFGAAGYNLANMPEDVIKQILSYSGLGPKQPFIGDKKLDYEYKRYITGRDASTADKWEYFRDNITTKGISNIQKLLMSNDRKKFVTIANNNIMNIMAIDPEQLLNDNQEDFILGKTLKSINLQSLLDRPINRVILANNTGVDNIIMLAIKLNEYPKSAILFIDLDEIYEFKPFILNYNLAEYDDFKLSPDKKIALAIPYKDFFNRQTKNTVAWNPFTGDIIWEK